jgi:microcin C transport system permease protein
MAEAPAPSPSPARRAWRRFRRNRLGFVSLVLFGVLVGLSLLAEVISNDKPLVARYDGQFYFPLLKAYPEKVFGGDFETETDYLDPFIQAQLAKPGNWAVYRPIPTARTPSTTLPRRPTRRRPAAPTGWAPTTAGATCWRS